MMTDDLTKTFFDTFEIDANADICWCEYDNKICDCYYECDENCRKYKIGYPQITDRILLELICILSKTITYVMLAYNIDELKQYVLSSCIRYSESIDRHKVRTLFKEG